ncbi:MAG: hypothetical protein GC131_04825 [Alphaproteobacteria bacterium]|nr:hypothetical protein [Alphaproteobacteria bacterium]
MKHVLTICCAALLALWAAPVFAIGGTETVDVPPVPYENPDIPNVCGVSMLNSACARLNQKSANTVLQPHGECYWLDNGSDKEYFVPYKTVDEWHAFLEHLPPGVIANKCCPSQTVTMGTLSDGRTVVANLGFGRSSGANQLQQSVSSGQGLQKDYVMHKTLCTTHWDGTTTCNNCSWTETLTLSANCTNGVWATSLDQKGDDSQCKAPDYIAPKPCPPDKPHGTKWWAGAGSYYEAGTSQSCHYEGTQENEMLCWDGKTKPTGQTRVADKHLVGQCEGFKPPTTDCFVHVSGLLMSDYVDPYWFQRAYDPSPHLGLAADNMVGEGTTALSYSFFANATAYTFDGIAIGPKARLKIWASNNYKGGLIVNMKGPALINNPIWRGMRTYSGALVDSAISKNFTGLFKGTSIPLQSVFPQSVRHFANENMHRWGTGTSVEVSCED